MFLSLWVWCDVCSLVYMERVNADVFWCVRNGLSSSMKFQQNSKSIFFMAQIMQTFYAISLTDTNRIDLI